MVAEAHVWVDVEGAVREFVRDMVPSVNRRVFFAANDDVSSPQIVVQRVAGPDDACRVQFDVWAAHKVDAAALGADLATAIDAMATYVHGGVRLHGAAVENVSWQPDPDSGAARYIIDATISASFDSTTPSSS